MSNLSSDLFFKLKMHQNPFSTGALTRTGAYDAPPDPLVGWGEGYSPSPFPPSSKPRRLRRLELGAVLGSQAPSTQIPGYASDFRYLEK